LRLGILEWVPGTETLKMMVTRELENRVRRGELKINVDNNDCYATVLNHYLQMLHNFTGMNAGPDLLINLVERGPSKDAKLLQVFEQFRSKNVPQDLLCSAIASYCSTPEAYIMLRSRFARSLAAFTVAGYILGIGDRHLDNYLVDSFGQVVPIDFGSGFGEALRLRVPELIPVRMTRLFLGIYSPLDSKTLLKQDMVHALAALRAHKDRILTVLDVFVKDPHLEWIQQAKSSMSAPRSSQASGTSSQASVSAEVGRFGESKIRICRLKLEGYNSAYIMKEEFEKTPHRKRKNFFNNAVDYIMGKKGVNKRADVGERCSSVEEQVDVLLDHATDPVILAQTWYGWAPYL